MNLALRLASISFLGVAFAGACSSAGNGTSSATTGTTTSTASTGGGTSAGGAGGTTIPSGSGGGMPSGSGGGVPSGSGGQGGDPGVQAAPECNNAGDCKLLNDCCNCASVSSLLAPPECRFRSCIQSTCSALKEFSPSVACSAGHCTMFDCDSSNGKVTCKKATPVCPAGEVPLVENLCWGGCVPVQQCNTVTDCTKCNTKTEVCVTESFKGGPSHHCVAIAPGCNGKPSCACMGDSVCTGSFDTCSDNPNEILCGCTVC